MTTTALVFMLTAWAAVLGLMVWCFRRLMQTDRDPDSLPPPGTSL